ncbi:UbiD family decarboxylase [Chenggangzhangella methanolivorans]|uniref:UbiD family decarboxylase n=1 Tax=Chenggangzhangella methanolivorans TaxID=1437009 RepID=UPI0028F43030|nr:UbiD family decarboxylase [Chenggangzhangella methanolivorans]
MTAGQITARDPKTGVDTTGFHRLMLKGKNRLGVSLHSRRRMHEFHRRAEEMGQSLPAAITLGVHPLHYMGSMTYAYPPHVRKFEIIGGLFGEPYRLARCGVQDLEVPAGAEIVIEGEILAGVHEPEGPFGESRATRPSSRATRPTAAPRTCSWPIGSGCAATPYSTAS